MNRHFIALYQPEIQCICQWDNWGQFTVAVGEILTQRYRGVHREHREKEDILS